MDSVPIGAQWQGGGAVADSGPVECGSSGKDDRERIVDTIVVTLFEVLALDSHGVGDVGQAHDAVITSRRARLTAANPRAGNPPVGSA
ncbi:hypothetical protein MCEMAEM6B_02518 [Mycobacteriaceae bacterium]